MVKNHVFKMHLSGKVTDYRSRSTVSVQLSSAEFSDHVRRFEKKFAECDNFFCKISVSIR